MPDETPGGDPDSRDDGALVEAINAGDVEAFETLYRRYRDWVFALALRFCGHRDDALDVLQETFSYVLRKFPGFELRARFTTFLYPAVRNLSIAARRKRGRFRPEEDGVEAAEAPPPRDDTHETRTELAAALASLPSAQREIVLLRYLDDLSLEEVAETLDVPLGTVKSRLHYALERLRQNPRLQRYFEG